MGDFTAPKGNTFMSAFCSRWWFKSCHLLFQHLYESKWHNRFSSFRCHKYCKHTIQTEPAVRQKAPGLQNVTSPPSPVHIVWACYEFSGQETSSLFQPDRQNGARLYLREVIPLIYKTPKQGFLPPHFPGANPSKGRGSLYWAHMHTREQKQNKQRPFKYQPTCLLFDWRRYCTAILCSALWNTDIDETEAQLLNKEGYYLQVWNNTDYYMHFISSDEV